MSACVPKRKLLFLKTLKFITHVGLNVSREKNDRSNKAEIKMEIDEPTHFYDSVKA